MSDPRFYAPEADRAGTSIDLSGEEAAHLTRVLRLGTGAQVSVFNGRGQEWQATVDEAGKRRVRVTLRDPVAPRAEPRVAVTLAVAVLKGEKMDHVVRDAVMLGVAAVLPMVTGRTETPLGRIEQGGRIARWQRIAVSSAKQCGRAVVPAVGPALLFDEVLKRDGHAVMLVEPGSARQATALSDLAPVEAVTVVVGPEGGWTPEEVDRAFRLGATTVTLGGLTLRADAVPMVAMAALRALWKDL